MAISFKAMSSSNSQRKKRNSGILGRSKKSKENVIKNPITEAELLSKSNVSPEDVLRLTSATESKFITARLFCIP